MINKMGYFNVRPTLNNNYSVAHKNPAIKLSLINNNDSVSFTSKDQIKHPIRKVVFFDVRDKAEEKTLSNLKEKTEALRDGCQSFDMHKSTLNDFLKKNQGKDFPGVNVISIISNSKVTPETIPNLKGVFPDLEMIVVRAAGYNNVDTNFCKDNGIKVVNTPGYANYAVAEYTMGLIHDVNRKISESANDLKTDGVNLEKYKGMELKGKTIGLVGGAGSIGSIVAELAMAHGMKVLVYDRNPHELDAKKLALLDKAEKFAQLHNETENEKNLEFVDFDTMLSQSDIISLHCPYFKDKNHHMFDEQAFNKMKDGAIIINTARGELIDTKALIDAVKSGKVGGAGLDVFEGENINPTSNLSTSDKAKLKNLQELVDLPGVVVTPHTAYNTVEAVDKRLTIACENVNNLIQGKTAKLNIVG